jgi:hypothetical protein
MTAVRWRGHSWEAEQRFARLGSDIQKAWSVTVFHDRLRAIKEEP